MDTLGKSLLLVFTALSLTACAWAFGLWVNHTDWTTTKGTQGKPDGVLVEKQQQYKQIGPSVHAAVARLHAHRDQVESLEDARPWEQFWYEQSIDALMSGDSPIQMVARGPDGKPIAVPSWQPPRQANDPVAPPLQMVLVSDPDAKVSPFRDRDGKPYQLKSMDHYVRETERLNKEVTAACQRTQAAAEADKKATDELIGEKGLHARLEFEGEKREKAADEYKLVRPMWLNVAVELENLKNLEKRVRARIEELEKGGKKTVARP